MNNKLDDYYLTIRRKFEAVNNTCVHFKEQNVSLDVHTFTLYGYCAHKTWKLFKIILRVNKNNVVGTVYSTGLIFSHKTNTKLTTYVRKTERNILGEKLKFTSSYIQRLNNIKNTPNYYVTSGN